MNFNSSIYSDRPLPHDAAPSGYPSAKRPTPGPPVSVGVSTSGPATLQMSHPAVAAAHHAAVMAGFDPYHLLNARGLYGLGLPTSGANQVPVSAPTASPFHHPLHHSMTGGAPSGPPPPGGSSGPPPGLSLHPATLNSLFIGPPTSHNGLVATQRDLVSHHLLSPRVAPSNMRVSSQELLAQEMAARNERMKLLEAQHQGAPGPPPEHMYPGRAMSSLVPSSTVPSSLSNSVSSSQASSAAAVAAANNARRRPSMLPPNLQPSADSFSQALINNSMPVVSIPSSVSSIPPVVSSRDKFDLRLPPIYTDPGRVKLATSQSSSSSSVLSSSVTAPVVFPPAPSSVPPPPPNSAGMLLPGSLPPGLLHGPPPSSGSQQGPPGLSSSHHLSNATITALHHPSPNHLINEIYKRQVKTNHSYGAPTVVDSSHSGPAMNLSAPGTNSGSHETSSNSTNQELSVDTQDNGEDGYNPHFEAISPTPNDETRYSPHQIKKDSILEDIRQVEGNINSTILQIRVLEMKREELQKMTTLQPSESEDSLPAETREPTLIQKIYLDNRHKAKQAHDKVAILGRVDPLPLYNHPLDLQTTHEIRKKYVNSFRVVLIERIKKQKRESRARQKAMVETYEALMTEWQKKLEKRHQEKEYQARQQKYREYFEKQFPELKKQREDRERLTRGQRIRSEAEMEELVDSLQWQELEERKNRHLAVIPPLLLDEQQRLHHFDNRNGLIEDPKALYLEMKNINLWTDGERAIFKEKYLLTPKKFGMIASHLERKSIGDCVLYYYLAKKKEHFKILLKKHQKKRTRAIARAQAQTGGAGTSSSEGLTIKHSNLMDGLKLILPYSVAQNSGPVRITIPPPNANGTRVLKSGDESDSEANASTSFFCDIVCCLCADKVEHIAKSFPVSQANAAQYGLTPEALRSGSSGRICARCHLKHVRQACPIPSCRTPKRKIKKMKLKLMPNGWFELSPELRQKYAEELEVPVDAKIGCLRCVAKVRRRIDKTEVNEDESMLVWNASEIEKLREAIKQHGKNWCALANALNTDKSPRQCHEFYVTNKTQFKLWQAYREHQVTIGKRQENAGGDSSEPTDDDDTSGSSNEEEKANNSDTASASSSISERKVEEEVPLTSTGSNPITNEGGTLQDLKSLSASQSSIKSDCDSSATVSADEGQPTEFNFARATNHLDLGPRNVPVSTMFSARDLITERTSHPPIPSFLINPNAPLMNSINATHTANHRNPTPPAPPPPPAPVSDQPSSGKEGEGGPTCVRDLIYKAIEISLQPGGKCNTPGPSGAPTNHQAEQPLVTTSNTTGTTGFPLNLKRENPTPEPNKVENHNLRSQSTKPEGLAASYYPAQSNSINSQYDSSECEVQDLSKKDRRMDSKTNDLAKNSAPVLPSSKSPFPTPPMGSMNPSYIQPAHSNQRAPYTDPFLHDPTKSRPPPQPSPFSAHSQPTLKLNKVSPKPSDTQSQHPNYRDKLAQPNTMPGSITQGTPVVLQPGQQHPSMPVKFSSFHHDIRFLSNENMLRPHLGSSKGGLEAAHGSITQGTPLVLGGAPNSMQMSNSKSKNNQGPEPKLLEMMERMHSPRISDNSMFRPFSPSQIPGMNPMAAKVARELGIPTQAQIAAAQAAVAQAAVAQAQAAAQAASNQQNQILIDYNTSKQMYQTPRRSSSSSDKEHHESAARVTMNAEKARTATSTPYQVSPAPSPGLFLNNRGELVRADDKLPPGMVDPTMLAPWNSSALLGPGGPNAYPLNRTNVIQGWNPASKSVIQAPKANSPRDYPRELELKNRVSPLVAGYPPSGQPGSGDHEDFNTLVNAAIQQQSLSVPSSMAQAMSASRLAKDVKQGFEKALMEQNKHANSNRIVFPGLPHSSVDELDLYKKQAEEKAKAFNKGMDARPPSVDSIDLSKHFPIFSPSHLTEHEKQQIMMMEQRKKMEMAALQGLRPELLSNQQALAAAIHQQLAAQNPGLRFSREPFTPEHFERGLRTNYERQAAVDEANKRKTLTGVLPTSSNITLSTHSDMDEASKLFSQSFQKDSSISQAEANKDFTAASLIHAIITRQINDPNSASLGNYVGNRHGKPGGNMDTPPPSATPPISNSHSLTANKQHSDKEMDGPNIRSFSMGKSTPVTEPPAPRNSFRETIFNVIKDNFNNNSNSQQSITPPPPTSTPSRMPIMQSQTILEGIAAAAAASPSGSNSSAENFKLRRALQSEERAAKEEFPNKRLAIEGEVHLLQPRQHVIHLPHTLANAVTGAVSASSSPLLTTTVPNLKSISNYIEPISPPNLAASSTATITTSAASVPTTATGVPPGSKWSQLPWGLPQHLSFMKPPGMGDALQPPSTTTATSHFGDFGFSSRIAEAMQRANPAMSSGSNAESDKKESSAMTTTPKKISEDGSARATPNNLSITNNTNDSGNAYPDSPSSPGEMVIDENRDTSSPDPVKGADGGGEKESGVIKLTNNVPKVAPGCHVKHDGPQFEPLSDDDT